MGWKTEAGSPRGSFASGGFYLTFSHTCSCTFVDYAFVVNPITTHVRQMRQWTGKGNIYRYTRARVRCRITRSLRSQSHPCSGFTDGISGETFYTVSALSLPLYLSTYLSLSLSISRLARRLERFVGGQLINKSWKEGSDRSTGRWFVRWRRKGSELRWEVKG